MSSPTSTFRSSSLYFVFAFIIFVAAGTYGFIQYQIFAAETAALADNSGRISQVSRSVAEEEKNLKTLATAFAPTQAVYEKKLDLILPEDENYTELTRQLDAFFSQHDKPGNPIFQSSLRYGKGEEAKDLPGISILPLSMNIEATRDNFFKFLQFVTQSGSIDSGIRLLSINSIQLNFPEGGEVVKDPTQKLNFTVDMNAYYRTPKVAR